MVLGAEQMELAHELRVEDGELAVEDQRARRQARYRFGDIRERAVWLRPRRLTKRTRPPSLNAMMRQRASRQGRRVQRELTPPGQEPDAP